MSISVVAGSASIDVPARPRVLDPQPDTTNDLMVFASDGITLNGACQLTGADADARAGWTLGFIQIKWINTQWSYYRGAANADGSTFLQYARPPALAQRSCRDTLTVGNIFIDNDPANNMTVASASDSFPIDMSAQFSDAPRRLFPMTYTNPQTLKPNYLREAQAEMHFCSVLSLMSPDGVYRHLKSIYWNVHWQATFEVANAGTTSANWSFTKPGEASANSATVSRMIDGGPTETKFVSVLTTPQSVTCNLLIRAAFANPNVRSSRVWANFNVTE